MRCWCPRQERAAMCNRCWRWRWRSARSGTRCGCACRPTSWTGSAATGSTAVPMGVRDARARGRRTRTAPAPMPDLITDQFDTVGAAAKGCDVILGANAHQYAARSIAEREDLPYVNALYAPVALPSPDLAPPPGPGPGVGARQPGRQRAAVERRPPPPGTPVPCNGSTHNRARLGLAPIDDVLRHNLTDRPWLAADATLGPAPAAAGHGRGADRRLDPAGPDARCRRRWRRSSTPATRPCTSASAACRCRPARSRTAPSTRSARAGRRSCVARAGPTSALSTTSRTASPSATSTSRRCSRGWRPSCTTAARARPSPPPAPACRRWWCRCSATSSTGPPGWARSASAPRCPPAR